MNLGSGELIIILLVVLLVFGGAKLPQLARSLGQAKVEFEKGSVESDTPSTRAEPAPDRTTGSDSDSA
ncbi:MAG: twin-arginine translocase TatA/TatE family subunit [Acidimicrobiales bacterium]